jgi:ADP-ribose pyrophosphatase
VPSAVEWTRIDREVLYQGRVVEVYRDRVHIGRDETREVVYDLVHHPGAVAIVPLFEDGRIALLHQFRYAVSGTIWEIPAGTLEPGESPEACAARELVEEIGCRAGRWTPLVDFYTSPGFCDETMRVFLAEDLTESEAALEPDEHIEVTRVPLAGAVGWAEAGRIRDAKTLVGLHAARTRLESEGRWPLGPP